MSQARPVYKDRTLMFTRRCAGRSFLLRPCKEVTQAFLYCFALAVSEYHLDVFWLSVLSNHYHDGLRDNEGNYPEFLRYFHSLVARCLNVQLGRWENFWATEQTSVVHLGDAESVFDKMLYSLTNPVKDHLVDKVFNWPGFNSLRYQLADKPVVIKRPHWFFDKNGKLPEVVELRFCRPPEFAHLSQKQWTDKLREAVEQFERDKAEQRRELGLRVLGSKAIRRLSPFSCPNSCIERRGMRPRVASRNKWRRIELLQANKEFVARYRAAFVRRRAGELDVLFPHGSYKLRKLGLVQCGPPTPTPPLE